jgi:hypothetical protein
VYPTPKSLPRETPRLLWHDRRWAYQWCVYEISQKPTLKLPMRITSDTAIIGAVVAKRGYASGGLMRIGEDELVPRADGTVRNSLTPSGARTEAIANVPPDAAAERRVRSASRSTRSSYPGVPVEQQV